MTTHPNRHAHLAVAASLHARTIGSLLVEADEAQWERSRKPGSAQSVGRSKGTHADPTPGIAMDPARLRLRDAVRHAERTIIFAERDLERAKGRLERALNSWAGG